MMDLSEQAFIAGILVFIWSEFLWEQYLTYRQLKVCKNNVTIPAELTEMLSEESFGKARLYSIDKLQFKIVKEFYSTIITTLLLCFGWLAAIWDMSQNVAVSFHISARNEVVVSCFFLIILTVINIVVNLPFTCYSTFVVEQKHGFNKQTVGFFIKDQIKSFCVGLAVSLPIAAAAVYIILIGGNMFVVYLWVFTTIATLLLLTLYPTVIAPLFDKFKPLPEGNLRSGIEDLASSINFPLSQVYIVEGSKRSAHSNAYFSGMFGAKRIVLFDTLIETYSEEKQTTTGCTDKEILGILAHELGHWKKHHIYKSIVITEINLLLLFIAFGFLFKYSLIYTSVGLPAGIEPVIIGLIVVLQMILAPYNAILGFFMSMLSRKFEFEADEFAVSLNYGDELVSSLRKLGKDNLDYPIYDKLYSAWYHSHPTLLHRIETIQRKQKAD